MVEHDPSAGFIPRDKSHLNPVKKPPGKKEHCPDCDEAAYPSYEPDVRLEWYCENTECDTDLFKTHTRRRP